MSADGLRPAVFLDRDGTINVEKNYLIDPTEFDFIPGVPEALKKLQDAGYLLVVVTNQSGVARGYFSEAQVSKLHEYMLDLLSEAGVALAGIYICPHHPTAGVGDYRLDCNCRKGKPGMLHRAARDLNIDLQKSFMVGDKTADIQAGQAAGCKTILVCTGHGQDFVREAVQYSAPVVADLPAAVEKICLS
jgi:D-glycero-D-manno-heptose 1,7-bisphosphate phosphatase